MTIAAERFIDTRMPVNPIFNPQGNDDTAHRSIWFGETTNLMQLNDVRYGWAIKLYRQMRENFWVNEKVDVTSDVTDYSNLTTEERRAYNGVLSYLTFLDSVQTVNLPQLKVSITAPEISMCMAEQISQEALHNAGYQYLIESIIPSEGRSKVYDFWRTNKVLFERCKSVAGQYQRYVDNPTQENYFYALWADYLLEGLYFWNGFQLFYSLASRQLMNGTADIIRYINRDELSHVRLFQKILPEAFEQLPHSRDAIYELTAKAVEHECEWTNHIIGNDVLGITEESTYNFTRYLANLRLKAVGLEPLYDDNANHPYKHLDAIADTGKGAQTKANFFEATVTSYNQSSTVTGWEEF